MESTVDTHCGWCGSPLDVAGHCPETLPVKPSEAGLTEAETSKKALHIASKIANFVRSGETDGGSNLTRDELAERIALWFISPLLRAGREGTR